eukprot:42783_1
MASKQLLSEWIGLMSCPGTKYTTIPTGIDKNNYFVIDYHLFSTEFNCIFKYNIDNDRWSKIDGLNINTRDISLCSTVYVKKQILYLIQKDSVSQIQLNNSNINSYTHDTTIHAASTTKSIMLNDSLFIIGGVGNNSILKWNSENKTFTKFSDMYNKMRMGGFALIHNHKNNCLLLFG